MTQLLGELSGQNFELKHQTMLQVKISRGPNLMTIKRSLCTFISITISDRLNGTAVGVRSTVVARWTACQQVERLILHQGHDSEQNSSH